MEIEVKQIIFQLINFGILFFVLSKFIFRPILDILDKRSERIAEGMAAAEKSLQEQAKLEEKKAAELARAEKKASALIAAARLESKKMGEELIAAAKAESQKAVAKQEAEFVEKLSNLEAAMQSRMADLVVETTKKALSDSLSTSALKDITASLAKKLK